MKISGTVISLAVVCGFAYGISKVFITSEISEDQYLTLKNNMDGFNARGIYCPTANKHVTSAMQDDKISIWEAIWIQSHHRDCRDNGGEITKQKLSDIKKVLIMADKGK